jgi:hypothetical protein
VIYLVYSRETDEEVAFKEAEEAAGLIKKAFAENCFKEQCWQWIELVECFETADSSLTFLQSKISKEWRTDDLSLRADD